MTMLELRQKIDGIHVKIVDLLGERLKIAKEIARIKKQEGLPLFDPEREEKVKKEMRKLAGKHQLSGAIVEEIFTLVMDYTRLEMEAIR